VPHVGVRRAAVSSAAGKRPRSRSLNAPDMPYRARRRAAGRTNQKIVHVRIVLDPAIE
jgi:hypothetical protein